MDQEDVRKEKKRRTKQLYFGKRDDLLWEYIQSLPDGEGNALIMEILKYHIFGGMKPSAPIVKGINDAGLEIRSVIETEAHEVKRDVMVSVELMEDLIR